MPGSASRPGAPGPASDGAPNTALSGVDAHAHPPWMHPPRWVTLWLPVVLTFFAQVPMALLRLRSALDPDSVLGGLFDARPREALISLVLAVLAPLILVGARRYPGPVVALIAVAASADLLLGDSSSPPYVALAFAVVGAVVRGARGWAWASIAAAWVGTLSIALLLGYNAWTPGRVAATTLGILIVMGVGEGLRTRVERAREYEREQRERRQTEVQAERVRIARELHDVLAHSLSQINVQAGVGLHLMERQPEKAADALASIKETSKSALDEVRAVLGVLRAERGAELGVPLVPEPDLERLEALAASVAASGLRVTLDDRLSHEVVPKPVQLAIYRVVQESLTNVQRHAQGARSVTVTLERRGAHIQLQVVDDGAAAPGPASESGGRGLLGMRERAELLGGHLTAGPGAQGGFRVQAEFPLPPDTPEE
ncbi:sensor histidine kinase [uncultured Schumannella sp.]|uniref:sensor histidine kinase n=1 Tax=uncultured Schumannella sp. TaxID=1195956 RepID=UPI0025CE4101|nr:sensor histidine kinase [uncultured Schumannella sp.]